MYEDEERVISVHGYIYPIKKSLPDTFFIKGADCLGWGTWKRGWDLFNSNGSELLHCLKERSLTRTFDFEGSYPYTRMLERQVNGEIGSWAIRWYASAFLEDKLTLYPGKSLIYHNGSDGSGTNCGTSEEFDVELSQEPILVCPIEIKESEYARKQFIFYFKYVILWARIKDRLRHIFRLKTHA